ncbi:hypothetical protein LSTR_LSTR011895 [Laodelphax striatellus]|uniref:Uncharacterized protein n=1 Tax=Laodelphax striatellus TaxID=195883 RepID=A0A482XMI0_LAOST|nr:hypothetical protein LSTR_LSTR011895 [Laodelphax striatellus]
MHVTLTTMYNKTRLCISSDDFIQAQQVLARSASDQPLPPAPDAAMTSSSYKMEPSMTSTSYKMAPEQGQGSYQVQSYQAASNPGITSYKVAPNQGSQAREYYPSPEEEHSGESTDSEEEAVHREEDDEDEDDDEEEEEEGELEAIVRQMSRPSSAMEEVRRHSLPGSSQDTLGSSSASPVTEQSALIRPKRYPEYKH